MKRVGILVGREKTFPDALLRDINDRGKGDVTADFITLGGIRHDDPPRYDLVIDRISHEVPFYRATLKRMALEGTIIIDASRKAKDSEGNPQQTSAAAREATGRLQRLDPDRYAQLPPEVNLGNLTL